MRLTSAQSPLGLLLLRSLMARPTMSPKAQLKDSMLMVISALAGTLTATGTKPRPHEEPGNLASMSVSPVSLDLTTNVGDFPMGSHILYSSPALP